MVIWKVEMSGGVFLESIEVAAIDMEYAMAAEALEIDVVFVWAII